MKVSTISRGILPIFSLDAPFLLASLIFGVSSRPIQITIAIKNRECKIILRISSIPTILLASSRALFNDESLSDAIYKVRDLLLESIQVSGEIYVKSSIDVLFLIFFYQINIIVRINVSLFLALCRQVQ